MKPVLFVTGHVPSYRAGALARLHEREGIEVALFGGRLAHGGELAGGEQAGGGELADGGVTGGAQGPELTFPHRRVDARGLLALAGAGEHRAVVLPTGGRLALLAGWAGARRAHVPLILWASLWAHPRSAAHAFSYVPLRRLYRSADAVVTYGPHVSAYVSARGARNVHEAPQSVDNDFWSAPDVGAPPAAVSDSVGVRFVFAGRAVPEKGLDVLLRAWRASGLRPPRAALLLAGAPPHGTAESAGDSADDGVVRLGGLPPAQMRAAYAACDVLVVPSIATRTFREPWGLVVNEAMNRGLAVIASDAVGAAAGGLVRDGDSGLVVPAGDWRALATALARMAGDAELRRALGAAGARAVAAYTHAAWAWGFSRALATLGLSREHW
jgi:glycosyltransferase involved in cell wall biosynthesis